MPSADPSITAPHDGTRRPAVLQVLPRLVSGGVERGTVEIAAALARAGWRPYVASAGGPMAHEVVRAGARHIELPLAAKNPLVIRANIGRLAAVIERHGIDIVHARSRAPAWSALGAARRTGVHFVTTFHNAYNDSNRWRRWYNSVMARGERVIAISRFVAEHAATVYGVEPARLRTIHRGVDLARFDRTGIGGDRLAALAERWQLPDGASVVMLPGRLTRWKGQLDLIAAIALLRRDDLVCLLVGSDDGRAGFRREVEAEIARRGLRGIVRIVDDCTDMPAAYMLADVVVSASNRPEGFGRVAVEAQAMGRPLVATAHGGSRETVVEGETGWLVPPGDPAALAGAITAALALDSAARVALAERAANHARHHFSTEAMCARTLGVYEELLTATAVAAA